MSRKTFKILAVGAVAFAVYYNALSNGFVYDDLQTVLNNPWIRDLRHIPEVFSSNLWGFKGETSNYYRPLASLLGILLFKMCGTDPFGYHLLSVMTHAGISILVLLISSHLISGLSGSDSNSFLSPAFITAMLFASHPIHTEAVAWSGAFTELSFSFFYLLSFYFYVLYTEGHKKGLLFSAVFFIFSALCKETALTLPVLVVSYDYILRNAGGDVISRVKRYLPYLAVSGIYLIARFLVLGGFAPVRQHAGLSIYTQLINVPPLLAKYLEKLVLPVDLSVFHVFHPIKSFLGMNGIISLLCFAAFVSLAFAAWKRDKVALFSLFLLLVPLLPAFYLQGLGDNVFAERYLYLPSFGFVLLVSLLAGKISHKRARPVVAVILAAVVCVYSFGTVTRNAVWKDDYTLWSDAVKKSPDSYEAYDSLGAALFRRGRSDEAVRCFDTALRIKPDDAMAHYDLGDLYARTGLIDTAIEQFQAAIRSKPDYVNAHDALGVALSSKGLPEEAARQFEVAVSLRGNDPVLHYKLGTAYGQSGMLDKAAEQLRTAIKLDPAYAQAHYNLGVVYKEEGMKNKALAQFSAAHSLNKTVKN